MRAMSEKFTVGEGLKLVEPKTTISDGKSCCE